MRDMETPVFTRADFDNLTRIMTEYGGNRRGVPRDWQIHIGPQTVVKFTFEGPVGSTEWAELVRVIGRYQKWYKDTPSEPLMTMREFAEEVVNKVLAARETPQPDNAQ